MKTIFARAGAICVLLGVAAVFLSNARKPEPPLTRQSLASFPMKIGDWNGEDLPPFEDSILKVLGVDDYLSRVYGKADGAAAGLYLGFYESQRQGDTIHSPMNCLPGAGWEPVSQGHIEMPNIDGAGRSITINRYVVQKGLDRNVVLYWYHGRGRVVASEYVSRALLIRDALLTNRTNGSLVRVLAPVEGSDEAHLLAAENVAKDFVRALFPKLDSYLP
jgi:EpsI family protein